MPIEFLSSVWYNNYYIHVSVVLQILIISRYHHIYFDNFFSSPDLLLDLSRVGLYACGTLRSNRKGFPQDLKQFLKKGLSKRGEYLFRQCGNLTVTLWQDSKPVVVIATNSDPHETCTVQRKAKNGTRSSVSCPASVDVYNKFMGGVDRNDQLRQYYSVRLKGRKCYKYLWWFLFDVAITNAYVLCKNHTDLSVPSLKEFRMTLAKGLINTYSSRKRAGRQSECAVTRRFCEAHFPRRVDTRHRCYYCLKQRVKKRHETTWFCHDCGLHLCHTGKDDDCFFLYHKQLRSVHVPTM